MKTEYGLESFGHPLQKSTLGPGHGTSSVPFINTDQMFPQVKLLKSLYSLGSRSLPSTSSVHPTDSDLPFLTGPLMTLSTLFRQKSRRGEVGSDDVGLNESRYQGRLETITTFPDKKCSGNEQIRPGDLPGVFGTS